MSESNPIRVFVSHVFEETFDYLRVFEFLESDERFYYLNVSKPDQLPAGGLDEIKDELIQQIKQAEVMLVLPAAFEQKPDLVRFQMDVAKANKIKMVGMKHIGNMAEVPQELRERCEDIIEWNEREMVDAIKLYGRGEDTQRWEVVDFPGIEELMKDD